DQYVYTLSSLRAFYQASEEVTWSEFEIFSANLLTDFTDVSWVGWAPRVKRNDLAEFEKKASTMIPGYALIQPEFSVPVEADKDAYPILYVMPHRENGR